MKYLFVHTASGASVPAFANIQEGDDGRIHVIARGQSEDAIGIALTREEFAHQLKVMTANVIAERQKVGALLAAPILSTKDLPPTSILHTQV